MQQAGFPSPVTPVLGKTIKVRYTVMTKTEIARKIMNEVVAPMFQRVGFH